MTATLAPPAPPATPRPSLAQQGTLVLPSLASFAAVMLSAVSLSPVFDDGGWFGATLLVVLAVTTAGAIALALRAPLFLVPIVQAAVLFSVLVARFTTDAPLGFVPSPDALRQLRTVLAAGMHDIDVYAPPIVVHDGIVAITALGLGCVAILVFVLHVATRMPVIAGAALIAVYVVPSFVLDDGSPWWSFVAVAVGWMVLLASDERVDVVAWGRVLRHHDGPMSSPLSGVSTGALRLGALALVVAVALPILVPALTDAVLGRHDTGVGGDGKGGIGASGPKSIDPTVSLRRNLTQDADSLMLSYSGPAPTYLRLVVVTSYADEKWQAPAFSPDSGTQVTGPLPADADLPVSIASTAPTRSYAIVDAGLSSPFLPVPEHLSALTVNGGEWYLDSGTRTVFGQATSTDQLSWQAESLQVQPTATQLRAAPRLSGSDLTDRLSRAQGVPASIATLATQIAGDASTDYDKVLAIQNWFLDNFTYSTATVTQSPVSGATYLDSFLKDKSGYCQQFAATMALMVQALGIPARVVVGFTSGTKTSGGWDVHGKDAHAWPEVYFGGLGWVRFEPTPGGGSNGTVAQPLYAPQSAAPITGSSRGGQTGATKQQDATKRGKYVDDAGTAAAAELGTAGPGTSADTWRARALGALLLLALLAGAVPAAWRWVRRRRRLSAQAEIEDMWDELRDTALDLGLDWPTSQTPRQAVDRVIATSHLRGDAAAAATRLGRATERARYAPQPPSTDGLADDVGTVRTALLARADRGVRVRAALLPASLRRHDDD
jgi:transglutaminase-like putative cysteine protease